MTFNTHWYCPHCERKFKSQSAATRHIRTVHQRTAAPWHMPSAPPATTPTTTDKATSAQD